jgi:hypothetical protein
LTNVTKKQHAKTVLRSWNHKETHHFSGAATRCGYDRSGSKFDVLQGRINKKEVQTETVSYFPHLFLYQKKIVPTLMLTFVCLKKTGFVYSTVG